ncbi:MAG: pyridoxamine 5'-phosphate oxidase family protein [Candidatus Rokubacteria bacterium]|nr:pyridoxamine 5'-phosphate oxidase family protein [Candidatus Rokubacteria bacterium]
MTEQLADARIQAFLGTKEVLVLAMLQSDGAPLATPMWFLHGPETLTMVSLADARKVGNLRRDARVCVAAEAGTRGDIRGVTVRGRAEILPDSEARRALAQRFLDKYHPDLERRWGGRSMPADRVMFRIVPAHVRSWGL